MVAQPGCEGLGGAAGQDVHDGAGLRVDEDGSVGVALAEGELVDTENPRGTVPAPSERPVAPAVECVLQRGACDGTAVRPPGPRARPRPGGARSSTREWSGLRHTASDLGIHGTPVRAAFMEPLLPAGVAGWPWPAAELSRFAVPPLLGPGRGAPVAWRVDCESSLRGLRPWGRTWLGASFRDGRADVLTQTHYSAGKLRE